MLRCGKKDDRKDGDKNGGMVVSVSIDLHGYKLSLLLSATVVLCKQVIDIR